MLNFFYKLFLIKFYIVGGRFILVFIDVLQRVRSFFGDLEIGSFLDEGDVGVFMFLLFKNVLDGKICNLDGKFFKRLNDIDFFLISY